MTADRLLRRRILVLIVVLDVLYVFNCLTPFLGLKYESAQAMYSELDPNGSNHLVLPRFPFFQLDTYASRVELETPQELASMAAGLQWFLGWSRHEAHEVHLPFLAYHFERLCAAAPRAMIRLRYVDADGSLRIHDDVCHDPELQRGELLGLYPACRPACYEELETWASGRWRSDAGEAAP